MEKADDSALSEEVYDINVIVDKLLSEHLEPGTVVFHCHSAQKQL